MKEKDKRSDPTYFKETARSCVSAGDNQFKSIYQWRWQLCRCPFSDLQSPQMVSLSDSGCTWFQGSGCLRHQWQLWKQDLPPLKLRDVFNRGFSNTPIFIDTHWVKLKFYNSHYWSIAMYCSLYSQLLWHTHEMFKPFVQKLKFDWSTGINILAAMIYMGWVKECEEWVLQC